MISYSSYTLLPRNQIPSNDNLSPYHAQISIIALVNIFILLDLLVLNASKSYEFRVGMSFDQSRVPLSPRGSLKSHHDRRREPYDQYQEFRTDHHSSHSHHHGRNLDYQNERGRSRARQKPTFEDAISKLDEILRSALGFYTDMKNEFHEETQGITLYAGSQILALLWSRKIKYSGGRPDLHATEADSSGLARTNFETVFHDLQDSFASAIASFPARRYRNSGNDGCDPASYDRLYNKLGMASRDIPRLAQTAPSNRNDADALTTELELLGSYLDKCRGLWDNHRRGSIENQGHSGFSPENAEEPHREPGETPLWLRKCCLLISDRGRLSLLSRYQRSLAD